MQDESTASSQKIFPFFGREHVMMDYYLEFVFPEKNICYIAVTENEDTEKGLSDFVPFKNLFNEWLAKDTSHKVKVALCAKHVAGQRICIYAPLGYKKYPEIKNAIIVDWVIEKIFELAYHGSGAASIAYRLIEEEVPTSGWLTTPDMEHLLTSTQMRRANNTISQLVR